MNYRSSVARRLYENYYDHMHATLFVTGKESLIQIPFC